MKTLALILIGVAVVFGAGGIVLGNGVNILTIICILLVGTAIGLVVADEFQGDEWVQPEPEDLYVPSRLDQLDGVGNRRAS